MVKKGKVATVGTFDGLHKGHRKVLDTVKQLAKTSGRQALAICFDRHPLETIDPSRAPGFIQSPSERTNELYKEGFEILTIRFTPEIAALTAEEWMQRMRDEHGVEALVVGYDNTFGCDGIGMSIEDFRQLGINLGMEVAEAPVISGVSSSSIRKHLRQGRIEEASKLLGRSFSLTGTVVHGKGLGAKIGFPTANLDLHYKAQLPADGVYAAEALLPDGSKRMSVVNIGTCPTVNDSPGQRSIEVHVINLDEDLYGQRLKLRFLTRLRDEMKFDSIVELTSRIRKDIQEALNLQNT